MWMTLEMGKGFLGKTDSPGSVPSRRRAPFVSRGSLLPFRSSPCVNYHHKSQMRVGEMLYKMLTQLGLGIMLPTFYRKFQQVNNDIARTAGLMLHGSPPHSGHLLLGQAFTDSAVIYSFNKHWQRLGRERREGFHSPLLKSGGAPLPPAPAKAPVQPLLAQLTAFSPTGRELRGQEPLPSSDIPSARPLVECNTCSRLNKLLSIACLLCAVTL